MALAFVFFNEASGTLARAGGVGPLGLTSWLGLGLALGREMLLGGVLGFALGLFLVPAHVAADVMDARSVGFGELQQVTREVEPRDVESRFGEQPGVASLPARDIQDPSADW